VDLTYSSDKSYKFIVGDYTYGKSRGKESVNRYYLHSRILQKLYGLHVWELFGQIEGNRFQNLKLRELLGVGVRFKLMRYLYLGSGLLYVHENLKDSDSNSFPSGKYLHRLLGIALSLNGPFRTSSNTGLTFQTKTKKGLGSRINQNS